MYVCLYDVYTLTLMCTHTHNNMFLPYARVCLDAKKPEHKERFIISEDVTVFLSISFEENLLPVILVGRCACTCVMVYMYMYMYVHVHVPNSMYRYVSLHPNRP